MSTNNNNVCPEEIEKFDQQADVWWDTEGPFKTLHDINPTRLQYIQNNININNKTVLDVGCGGGILAESLAAIGAQVTGVDRSPNVLKIAREHARTKGVDITYINTDLAPFAELNAEQFDVVTCFEMLEHVPNPQAIIQACAQALKPGGHLFLSTLNRSAKSFLYAIVGAEYILNLLPRGTHQYDKMIKPSECHRWLRACDLQVKSTKGLWYQPFSRQSGLHDDVSVNYFIHSQRS